MSEQEPEAEDRLSKDVEDSVNNNLLINVGNTTTTGNTPDTRLSG